MLRILRSLAAAFLVALCLVSCGNSGSGSGGASQSDGAASGTGQDIDPGLSVSAFIGPSGGSLRAADGATLVIPRGALGANTLITVVTPTAQTGDTLLRTYSLQPDGLQFNAPITMTIPYPDLPGGTDPEVQLIHSSALNPLRDQGSEAVNWVEPTIVGRDTASNTLTFELEHFTIIYGLFYRVDDFGYLVIDIPHQFLNPGDLLFTLTDAQKEDGSGVGMPSWDTGHVGIYSGPRNSAAPELEGTVIESQKTGLLDNFDPSGLGGVTGSNALVGDKKAPGFKTAFGHLYLGPRRPAGALLTSDERKKVVSFLKAQQGRAYSVIGGGNITNFGGFSCVGLAEAGLDEIGRGALGRFEEATVSTPLEMYCNTVPITEITVRVGQKIEIPIYGVLIHPQSPTLLPAYRGFYTRERLFPTLTQLPVAIRNAYYTITANLSGGLTGASFTESGSDGYLFKWTPLPQHAGKTFNVPVNLSGDPKGIAPNGEPGSFGKVSKSETLIIHVIESNTPITVDNTSLAFEHVVTVSPCPQVVGTVTVTNNSGKTRRFFGVPDAASPSLQAIVNGSDPLNPVLDAVVPPGGSVTFQILFDCSQTESYMGGVTFKGLDESIPPDPDVEINVPVQATIKHKAVKLDEALGPFPAGTLIRLSRIIGGIEAGPDLCATDHLHGSPDITVDSLYTEADPDPTGCGFGEIVLTEGGN